MGGGANPPFLFGFARSHIRARPRHLVPQCGEEPLNFQPSLMHSPPLLNWGLHE